MQNQGQVKCDVPVDTFYDLPLTAPSFLQIITLNIRKAMTEESKLADAAREVQGNG